LELLEYTLSAQQRLHEDFSKKYLAEFLKTKDTLDLIPILKPIWNPLEKLWVQYIEKFLFSKDDKFGDLNDKVKKELGESFFQFAGRTGKFRLSKKILSKHQ